MPGARHHLQPRPSEPERVSDHGDRAERHGRARYHGAQEETEKRIRHPRRNGDAEGIVNEGEE